MRPPATFEHTFGMLRIPFPRPKRGPTTGPLRRAGRLSCVAGTALFLSAPLAAQSPAADALPPLALTSQQGSTEPRDPRAPILLQLSRAPVAADGPLSVVVGGLDLTALLTIEGARLTIVPGSFPLPAGSSTLVVWRRDGRRFVEVGRLPLRVRFAGGFDEADWAPTVDGSSNGALGGGGSEGVPRPRREQIVSFTVNHRTRHVRGPLRIETQATVLGATADERALRFGQLGARAPRFDLASYQVAVETPSTRLDLGHVSIGNARHLVSSFSSRGALLRAGPSWAKVSVGSAAGSAITGWDNPLGLAESGHRMFTAALDLDLDRRHPGRIGLRITGLDGALAPRPGFTQGAVTDAESSTGSSVEFQAATPDQRARINAGYTTSSFVNPLRDPELTGFLAVAPLRRDRRSARFVEATWSVLQGRRIARLPVSLGLTGRHERIDPLFRSVGAFAQADREQTGLDASLSIDALALQGSASTGRDNLGRIASILTSLTESRSLTASTALASLLRIRRGTSSLPQLSFARSVNHQYAQAAPASNDFRPEDLADQVGTSTALNAQWQLRGWSLGVRGTTTLQDNRQPTRATADFRNRAASATLSRAFGARADLALDISRDEQMSLETRGASGVRRIGLAGHWRPFDKTSLGTNITVARSDVPSSPRPTSNLESQLEWSQRLALFGRGASARTGQFFVRYARTLQRAPTALATAETADAFLVTRLQWSWSSGLSLRLW